MTEAVVPGGAGRSNLSRARDDKSDRDTRDKEHHRDGDDPRAREMHYRQVPGLTPARLLPWIECVAILQPRAARSPIRSRSPRTEKLSFPCA